MKLRQLPPDFPVRIQRSIATGEAQIRVGMDLVQIERIQQSIDQFGDRFLHRVFTSDEVHYAQLAHGQVAERLAARFAAKEATLKALALANCGVAWREMEVCRAEDGQCTLKLHGKAQLLAREAGVEQTLLSLSHDGGYAGAFLVAIFRGPESMPSGVQEHL